MIRLLLNTRLHRVWTLGAVFILLLTFLPAQAQYGIRDYVFQSNVGTFTPITGGISLGDPTSDDQLFNDNTVGVTGTATGVGFPIGFPFTFGGVDYSGFAVSNNGYIKLGNGTFTIMSSTTASFTSPFDSLTQRLLIAGLHLDLKNQTNSDLSFKTIGSTGNRELVVQWLNFKSYLGTDPENYSFQIRLKENGNKIVIVYDNFIKNPTDRLVTVGLKGEIHNDVHTRKIVEADNDTWETSKKSTLNDTKADLKTNFKPDTGLTYTFSPPVPTPNDAGVVSVMVRSELSSGCPATDAEVVRLVLKNFGTAAQDSLRYRVFLNGTLVANNVKQYSTPLASGGRDTITLSQTLNMFYPGNYTIKATTALANDTGIYTVNDTAKFAFTNLGAVSIPFPIIKNFAQFGTMGWKQYTGKPKPQTPGGSYAASTMFANASTAIYQSAFATVERNDWMISPTYDPKPNMILKFRAAITGFDTITPIANISDDEFKIMVSTDCGASWTVLKTFNNDALSSGEINNTKKGFQVPLTTLTVPFQLAFFAADKNTVALASYYFHLDDVVIGQGNALDMACKSIQIENQNNPGCDQTTFPVKVWVKNVGDSAVGSYVVSVRVNANTPVVQTLTPSPKLVPRDSAEITFPSIAVAPNNTYKIIASTQATLEDGYSADNDTASTSFYYLGSANPLPLPASIDFTGLSNNTIPAGWLVDQGASIDFRIRSRGVSSSKSLSANFTPTNPGSFAIMPVTQPLPANFMLAFDLKFSNDFPGTFTMGAADSLMVVASDDCGNTFTNLLRIDASHPQGFNAFANVMIDLSAFANKSVSIRFDAKIKRTDFAGAWIDIDNINIAPNTAVNQLIEVNQLTIFPNPSQGKVNIAFPTGESFHFQIMDASGRTVKTGDLNESTELDLSHIQKGIYFLEATGRKGHSRNKLVIQ